MSSGRDYHDDPRLTTGSRRTTKAINIPAGGRSHSRRESSSEADSDDDHGASEASSTTRATRQPTHGASATSVTGADRPRITASLHPARNTDNVKTISAVSRSEYLSVEPRQYLSDRMPSPSSRSGTKGAQEQPSSQKYEQASDRPPQSEDRSNTYRASEQRSKVPPLRMPSVSDFKNKNTNKPQYKETSPTTQKAQAPSEYSSSSDTRIVAPYEDMSARPASTQQPRKESRRASPAYSIPSDAHGSYRRYSPESREKQSRDTTAPPPSGYGRPSAPNNEDDYRAVVTSRTGRRDRDCSPTPSTTGARSAYGDRHGDGFRPEQGLSPPFAPSSGRNSYQDTSPRQTPFSSSSPLSVPGGTYGRSPRREGGHETYVAESPKTTRYQSDKSSAEMGTTGSRSRPIDMPKMPARPARLSLPSQAYSGYGSSPSTPGSARIKSPLGQMPVRTRGDDLDERRQSDLSPMYADGGEAARTDYFASRSPPSLAPPGRAAPKAVYRNPLEDNDVSSPEGTGQVDEPLVHERQWHSRLPSSPGNSITNIRSGLDRDPDVFLFGGSKAVDGPLIIERERRFRPPSSPGHSIMNILPDRARNGGNGKPDDQLVFERTRRARPPSSPGNSITDIQPDGDRKASKSSETLQPPRTGSLASSPRLGTATNSYSQKEALFDARIKSLREESERLRKAKIRALSDWHGGMINRLPEHLEGMRRELSNSFASNNGIQDNLTLRGWDSLTASKRNETAIQDLSQAFSDKYTTRVAELLAEYTKRDNGIPPETVSIVAWSRPRNSKRKGEGVDETDGFRVTTEVDLRIAGTESIIIQRRQSFNDLARASVPPPQTFVPETNRRRDPSKYDIRVDDDKKRDRTGDDRRADYDSERNRTGREQTQRGYRGGSRDDVPSVGERSVVVARPRQGGHDANTPRGGELVLLSPPTVRTRDGSTETRYRYGTSRTPSRAGSPEPPRESARQSSRAPSRHRPSVEEPRDRNPRKEGRRKKDGRERTESEERQRTYEKEQRRRKRK